MRLPERVTTKCPVKRPVLLMQDERVFSFVALPSPARQLLARLDEASTAEDQAAFDMLDFFLDKHHPRTTRKEDVFVEDLLGGPEIQTALGQPLERLRRKNTECYCDMFGILADSMDHDEFDELMREVAKGQEPEKPSVRVLPFPPPDVEDDGEVN